MVTEFEKEPRLTEIRALYSELVGNFCWHKMLSRVNEEWIEWLKR